MDGPVVDQAAAPAGQTRAESGEQLCCRLLAGPLQRPPGGTGHRWETSRADGIRSIGPGPGRAAAVQSLLSTSRGSARRRRPNFYPLPQRPRTRRLIAGPQTEPHPKQRGSTRAGHSPALAPPCRFRCDLLGGESAPQLIDPALQPRPPPGPVPGQCLHDRVPQVLLRRLPVGRGTAAQTVPDRLCHGDAHQVRAIRRGDESSCQFRWIRAAEPLRDWWRLRTAPRWVESGQLRHSFHTRRGAIVPRHTSARSRP